MPDRFDPQELAAGLFRDHSAVMLLIDPSTGRIESANSAAEKFYGFPAGRLCEMSIQDINILHPDEVAAERRLAAAQARTFFKFKHRLANGRELDVAVHSSLIMLGQHAKLFSIVHDRTGLATVERALRMSEERWSVALETSETGVWEWDVDSGHAYYSERWRTMLGYGSSDIGATRSEWSARVHPDDLMTCRDQLDAHFRGETALFECEHRMRHKDGSWRWILNRGKVVARTDEGSPTRMVGTHQDLTPLRQMESNLQQSRQETQEALDLVRALEQALPLCVSCRRVHGVGGQWRPLDLPLSVGDQHSNEHGLCPDCARELYGASYVHELVN